MTVKLLGRSIKIKYVNQKTVMKHTHQVAYGCFNTHNMTVYIDKNLNERLKQITLYHELFHAVLNIVGLDQVIPPEIQELLCENFANAIIDLK